MRRFRSPPDSPRHRSARSSRISQAGGVRGLREVRRYREGWEGGSRERGLTADILADGGGKSPVANRLDRPLNARGWVRNGSTRYMGPQRHI